MASLEEIEKYICVICQELLLEPVILPCKHTACLYCLEQTLDNNKYQCFLCRKSIQSWYRTTKRKGCLVSTELKDEIEYKFAEFMEKRRNGESLDLIPVVAPKIVISDPGEIKRDFEVELTVIQTEIEKQKEREHKLSEDLIRQITEEEEKLKKDAEEKIKRDEEIARQLALELNAASTSVSTMKNDAEEKIKKDEELARQLALELNASTSAEKNNTMILDEKLARELARDLVVSEFPLEFDVVPKKIESTQNGHRDLEKSRNEGFMHLMQLSGPSKSNEGPTRKLSDCFKSPSAMKSKVSPRIKQQPLKKQPTAKYGPMDRFLAFKFEEPREM